MREAPIQRYGMIPWSVHLRIYEGYAKKYGNSQTPERIAERGGFGVGEADLFYPSWRADVEELPLLRKRLAEVEAERDAAQNARNALAQHAAEWEERANENARLWREVKAERDALRASEAEWRRRLAVVERMYDSQGNTYQILVDALREERDRLRAALDQAARDFEDLGKANRAALCRRAMEGKP